METATLTETNKDVIQASPVSSDIHVEKAVAKPKPAEKIEQHAKTDNTASENNDADKNSKPAQNQQRQNNGQQRKHRPTPKSAFDIVTTTSAKSVSYRTIKLRHKQLENNIIYCERIASSIMTITGSLVRCKKFDIQEQFDAYIEVLLMSYTQNIKATLADFESKVAGYTSDGYEFVDTGKPGNIRVEIRSNHVACLLDLILSIDRLMTVASHLEKTPSLSSPELYSFFSDWITIPRNINSSLMSLISKLDSNFRLKVKVKNDAKATENVNFIDVLEFMTKLKDDQTSTQRVDNSPMLAKDKTAPKPKASSKPTPKIDSKQISEDPPTKIEEPEVAQAATVNAAGKEDEPTKPTSDFLTWNTK